MVTEKTSSSYLEEEDARSTMEAAAEAAAPPGTPTEVTADDEDAPRPDSAEPELREEEHKAVPRSVRQGRAGAS